VLDTNLWLSPTSLRSTTGYASMFAGRVWPSLCLRGFLFTRTLLPETGKKHRAHDLRHCLFRDVVQFRRTILEEPGRTNPGGDSGDGIRRKMELFDCPWNATVLHVALGSYDWRKGDSRPCYFGNVIHEFSWFGVNMLVRVAFLWLHDAAFNWLMLFVVSRCFDRFGPGASRYGPAFENRAARRVAWPKRAIGALKDSDHSDHITAPSIPAS